MYEFEHCLWILPKAFDFVGRSIGGEPELLNSPAFSGLKHCLCDRVPLFVYITDQGSAVFVGHIANRLLRISHHRMILLSAFNLVLLILHASSNHLPFIHILFDLFFCHPAHLRAPGIPDTPSVGILVPCRCRTYPCSFSKKPAILPPLEISYKRPCLLHS